MMLFLPLALVVVIASRWRSTLRFRLAAVVVFVVAWMAVVSPITLRNAIMSETPVLITSGQARTFVIHNLPVNDPKYLSSFEDSLGSAARGRGNPNASRSIVRKILELLQV